MQVLILALYLASTFVLADFQKPQKSPPNIVLFMSDDHGYRHSGIYGDPNVSTPNMDKLASKGMRFLNAYAPSPLCSPSRSAIHTGMFPYRSGAHKFATPISSGLKTTPQYLKEAGYYTIHTGKFHHSGPDPEQFKYDVRTQDEFSTPEIIRTYDKKEPLFLVVCSHDSHTPWLINERFDPKELILPPNFVDTPESRKALADYYTDVESIDTQLGAVMQALKDKGMADNTLLIYTTDQGAMLPFGKWCLYNDGIRVPFIARWPGKIEKCSICEAMISLIDLIPTFLEASGNSAPDNIDGISFLNVLLGNEKKHREVIFAAHTGNDNGGPTIANFCPTRAVRTKNYKYILNLESDRTFQTHTTGSPGNMQGGGSNPYDFWGSWVRKAESDPDAKNLVHAFQHRPKEELFDNTKDPYEMNNLINNDEYTKVLQMLRKELKKWRKQQGDDVPMNTGPYRGFDE